MLFLFPYESQTIHMSQGGRVSFYLIPSLMLGVSVSAIFEWTSFCHDFLSMLKVRHRLVMWTLPPYSHEVFPK